MREGDALFTLHGVEAGRFDGDEIYGADGAYLGELMNGKLITNQSKMSSRSGSFSPRHRMGLVGNGGRVGTMIHAGYEDFPDPESFQ